jgi:hypothetical protein
VKAARARYAGRRLSGVALTLSSVSRRLLRLAVFGVVLGVLLAGLTSAGAATPPIPVLDPLAMPWLPAQGLVIQQQHDVKLVGLDGRVYGRLPGFQVGLNSRGELLGTLASYLPDTTLLQGPQGRSWLLADGRLTPINPRKFVLPGGAELDGRFVTTGYGSPGNPVAKISIRDTRSGTLLARGSEWSVVAGRLLVTAHVVTDLVTRERWKLGPTVRWGSAAVNTCTPAGVHKGSMEAVCTTALKKGSPGYRDHGAVVRFFAVTHDGHRDPLGLPFLYLPFGAVGAYLSPDAAHIAATLAVGCGPPYAYVGRTHGGAAHYVTGAGDTGMAAKGQILGWSATGSLVSEIGPGGCEGVFTDGIYLVNPDSFARALVYPLGHGDYGYSLWSPS